MNEGRLNLSHLFEWIVGGGVGKFLRYIATSKPSMKLLGEGFLFPPDIRFNFFFSNFLSRFLRALREKKGWVVFFLQSIVANLNK